jgi:hypothetical protein
MSHTPMTGDMLPTAHRLPASQPQYLYMFKTQIYSKSLYFDAVLDKDEFQHVA